MRLCCWASLSGQLWLYLHLWSWYSFRARGALSSTLYLMLSILCQAFCFYLHLVSGQHRPFLQNNNLTLIIGACHIRLRSRQHQVPWRLCHLWTDERLSATAVNCTTVQKKPVWYHDRWLCTYRKTPSKQEVASPCWSTCKAGNSPRFPSQRLKRVNKSSQITVIFSHTSLNHAHFLSFRSDATGCSSSLAIHVCN